MSTIGTNSEDLILNADGSGSDIKFKSNGTEVASISDSGVMTATSFAGSGANLTGVGVNGISSSADATAITIDSAEQVYISNSNNGNNTVHIKALNATGDEANLRLSGNISGAGMGAGEVAGSLQYFNNTDHIASISGMRDGGNEGQLSFKTRGSSDSAPVEQLKITKDGRGLSQFTAKGWVQFDGSGTLSIKDSHNLSSVTDSSNGHYEINWTVGFANDDYSATATSGHLESADQADSYSITSIRGSGIYAGKVEIQCLRARFDVQQTGDPKIVCLVAFGD